MDNMSSFDSWNLRIWSSSGLQSVVIIIIIIIGADLIELLLAILHWNDGFANNIHALLHGLCLLSFLYSRSKPKVNLNSLNAAL